jgi:hypothetical protein
MTKTNKHIAVVRKALRYYRARETIFKIKNKNHVVTIATEALTHLEELERCCNCQGILDSSE